VIASDKPSLRSGAVTDVIVYAARGIPLVIARSAHAAGSQGIMFHRESGIRSFKDLDKRNIMAVPGANFVRLWSANTASRSPLRPSDFGMVRFLADKQFVQQCFITNEPFYVKQQGVDAGVLLLSESGFSPYRVWYASREFLRKNPEAARAFTAASIRGWRDYIEGDSSAANKRIGELNQQMQPAFVAYSVGAMKDHKLCGGDPAAGETYGQIRAARIDEQIKQLTEIGVLDQPIKTADIFDGSFLLPKRVRGTFSN